MIEQDIEDYLCERAIALGGEVRKVRWIGRRHAPDRRVMLPGACFWVEVKRPGGAPRPGQAREIERMLRLGEAVFVVSTMDEVDAVFAAVGFSSSGV